MVEVGGPEALSRNEALAVAEQLIGRKLKRQSAPLGVARLGMKLLDRRNDALASVFATGVLQDTVEPRWDDAPLRQVGISPRAASDWLKEQAAAIH